MFLPSFLTASAWRLVARPVLRLGGALLLGGTLASSMATPSSRSSNASSYRLLLSTESDPACVYGSAWNDGDVVLDHDTRDGKTVTFTSRYDFEDGCVWEASEILTPDGNGYGYQYTERAVSCAPGAVQGLACLRRGYVSVVPNR